MPICTGSTTAIGPSNYADLMPEGDTVLPAKSPTSGFTRDASGRVTSDIQSYIKNTLLPRLAVAPPSMATTDAAAASVYANKAKALRDKIDAEYCFYYRRYSYALTRVLNMAATGDADTLSKSADYNAMKNAAITANTKLNDLIELLNGLVIYDNGVLEGYYKDGSINSLNTRLSTTKQQLKASSEMLKSSELEVEAKKAMIDYTLEKNSASRNMLALYTFLNLVAGGLLFYLYKSA